jgi:hypothetical protein
MKLIVFCDEYFLQMKFQSALIVMLIIESGERTVCNALKLSSVLTALGGAQWHSLLRHCATSQKVAGLIHDGVTRIFH